MTAKPCASAPSTSNTPAYRQRKYVVESILHERGVHLISGLPRIGKTTFTLRFISKWMQGLPVFGHQSFPVPFCYVNCTHSRQIVRQSLLHEGITSPDSFPAVSMHDRPSFEPGTRTLACALSMAHDLVPNFKVLFLNGIHSLCPGRVEDPVDVRNFLWELSQLANTEDITIFGIGYLGVTSYDSDIEDRYEEEQDGDGYEDEYPRRPHERFSVPDAWDHCTDTQILIESVPNRDPEREFLSSKRIAKIIPRHTPTYAPPQTIRFDLDCKASGDFTAVSTAQKVGK